MIAAGTQATEGRLCSPLTVGPIARRSQLLLHMASPSSVPITSDMAKPIAPRLTLVQMASPARPSTTVSQNVSATLAGEGSAYGGLRPAMYTSCQTPIRPAKNTIGGSNVRTNRRPRLGLGGSCGVESSASSPATTSSVAGARLSATTARRLRSRSLAMTADLPVQFAGDLRGQRAHVRRLDGPRVRNVDRPLADDPAGPRPHEDDALTEPGRLADVVRDEHDRQALLLPHPDELLVQHVAGDGVERGERLVHEQHGAVLGERAGQRHALPHAAGELVHPLGAVVAEVHQLEQALRLLPPGRAAHPAGPQRQLDVGR